MNTSMTSDAQKRAEESARKKAMTRSITGMVESAEECIQGTGGMEIISERLPRGIHSTMMNRNRRTGQIDYSRQDDEAERVAARLLYRKLSQAVVEPGDSAVVIVSDLVSQSAPEYAVPKMVSTVRGFELEYAEPSGFSKRRLSPEEVEEISPRYRHARSVEQDARIDTTPNSDEEEAHEVNSDIDSLFNEEQYHIEEDPPRKVTYEEKLEIYENMKAGWKNPQYLPEDEVRYL